MLRHLPLAAVLLLASNAASADAACDVDYLVTPRYDLTPRRLEVVLSFAPEGRQESWLRLAPDWAGIKDYGAALSPAAQQPGSAKLGPGDTINRWKVEHAPEGRVRIAYEIRAALKDPDDGKVQDQQQLYRTQIGADWFQFFGYGVLPSVEAWGDDRSGRMCLTLVQPEGRIGPLLGSHFDGAVRTSAAVALQGSHSQLRDAFYAGGPGWRVVEREVAGAAVITASRGAQSLDDAPFADQVARLIGAQRRFWGDRAPSRQTVARTPNFSTGNNGGTLVRQAAVLHVGTDFTPNSEGFEFLIGHENLHQWLPNRLGGQSSSSDEESARHYWMSEGFTNYYTHRLLLGSGLWTLERYADRLSQVLRAYWRSPARNAGADSIAPRFFSDRDAGRQMYARGEFLAMDWDRALRASKQPAGLDGLLRPLLLPVEAAQTAGPAHERVLVALTRAIGPKARQDVARHVGEGRSFELDPGLAGPCFTLGWRDEPLWVLGFDPQSFTSGDYKAVGVVVDGPAHRAGLREGMEFKGWSVHGGDVTKEIVLKLKSEAGIQELRYLPVDGRLERLPVLSVRPGAATAAACRAWQRH